MPTYDGVHVWRDFPPWLEPGLSSELTLHMQNTTDSDAEVRWVDVLPPGFSATPLPNAGQVSLAAGSATAFSYTLRFPNAQGPAVLQAQVTVSRGGNAASYGYETPLATYTLVTVTEPEELPQIAERLVEVVNSHPQQGQLFAANAVTFCEQSAGIALAPGVQTVLLAEMGELFAGLPVPDEDYVALLRYDLVGLYPLRRLHLSTEEPCETDYVPVADFSPYPHEAKEV